MAERLSRALGRVRSNALALEEEGKDSSTDDPNRPSSRMGSRCDRGLRTGAPRKQRQNTGCGAAHREARRPASVNSSRIQTLPCMISPGRVLARPGFPRPPPYSAKPLADAHEPHRRNPAGRQASSFRITRSGTRRSSNRAHAATHLVKHNSPGAVSAPGVLFFGRSLYPVASDRL